MGLFNRLDADGDGVVTKEEAANAKPKAGHMLSRLDANNDGEVTSAEIDAKQTEMRDRLMKRFDVNGDGTINKADQTARIEKRFERFDTDKDGKVTREEAEKVMKEWRQKRKDAMEQLSREFWGMDAS
ncbi:MAG: EF-hand domain-containing protein, partial [Halocynthiibacter sp.]